MLCFHKTDLSKNFMLFKFDKNLPNTEHVMVFVWGRGGLMVSALDSRASAPGSRPGRGHCVVFLGKTRHPHSVSLHPGV